MGNFIVSTSLSMTVFSQNINFLNILIGNDLAIKRANKSKTCHNITRNVKVVATKRKVMTKFHCTFNNYAVNQFQILSFHLILVEELHILKGLLSAA